MLQAGFQRLGLGGQGRQQVRPPGRQPLGIEIAEVGPAFGQGQLVIPGLETGLDLEERLLVLGLEAARVGQVDLLQLPRQLEALQPEAGKGDETLAQPLAQVGGLRVVPGLDARIVDVEAAARGGTRQQVGEAAAAVDRGGGGDLGEDALDLAGVGGGLFA